MSQQTHTITLSDGTVATVKRGKGRDLMDAQAAASTPGEVMFYLIAMLCTFNGEPRTFEDILEMDLPDVVNLQSALEKKPPTPTQPASSS